MLVPLFFAVLFSLAFAEEDLTYPGKCPTINVVDNFDINKYVAGPWYTAYYHSKGDWFKQQRCPECRLTYDAANNRVDLVKYYLNDSVPVWKNKSKEHLVAHPGSFQSPKSVRDVNTDWWYHVVSKIVQTDYVNYATWWGCFDIPEQDKHYEFAIVSSRQRGPLPEEHFNTVKAYFTQHHPTVSFQPISWDDCRARCPTA